MNTIQLEQKILSLLVDYPQHLNIAESILRPKCFSGENKIVYETIISLSEQEIPIDTLTIYQELKKQGIEINPGTIAALTGQELNYAKLDIFCKMLYEKFLNKELGKLSAESAKRVANSNDPFEIMVWMQEELTRLESNIELNETTMVEDLPKIIEDIENRMKGKTEAGLMSSTFPSVNKATGGIMSTDYVVIFGNYKQGKCHGRGTKIMLHNGTTKNVEDISINDLIMGDDGTPRKILKQANGKGELFKVTLRGGETYTVNGEHILCLKKYGRNGIKKTIRVYDYIKQNNTFKKEHYMYRPECLKLDEKQVLIEPYFLGLWLGDGNSAEVRISTLDAEIINYLDGYSKRLGLKLVKSRHTSGCGSYGITKGKNGGNTKAFCLKGLMKLYDLIDNKHIPKDYLINSEKNRMLLLAGLIDSDGYLNDKNIPQKTSYIFCNNNEVLIDNVVYLCRSLGFSANKKKLVAKLKSRNYQCETFRVYINGDVSKIPCKVARKQITNKKELRNVRAASFKIESVGEGEYFGFSLDKNNLYLLDNFIINHNSTVVEQLLLDFALDKKAVGFFNLEMSKQTLYQKALSMRTGIDYLKLRNPKGHGLTEKELDWLKIYSKQLFQDTKFYVEDKVFDIDRIITKIKAWKKKYNIQLFAIDYLGLLETTQRFNARYLEMGSHSRRLKNLAKLIDTPIIVLSQANEDNKTAESKNPARDADFVISVCKPVENNITSILDKNGQRFNFTPDHFLVTMENSRHGKNKQNFVCEFQENNFVEITLEY